MESAKNKNVVLVRLQSYLNICQPPLGIGYLIKVLNNIPDINQREIRCYFSFPNGVRLDRLDEETIIALN